MFPFLSTKCCPTIFFVSISAGRRFPRPDKTSRVVPVSPTSAVQMGLLASSARLLFDEEHRNVGRSRDLFDRLKYFAFWVVLSVGFVWGAISKRDSPIGLTDMLDIFN